MSTVLAAFMGGLALGSYLLGAWADRNREKALRTYGLLEIAIALLGLAVPAAPARRGSRVPGPLPRAREGLPMLFFVAQFLLVGLVLILPCVLMGGTLPILARWLIGREDEIGGRVGTLYAANTFGAAAGTAAATYVLLPRAGVREGELVAVADQPRRRPDRLRAVSRRRAPGRSPARRSRARRNSRRERVGPPAGNHRASRLAIGLSGFACMVDEVVWARMVSLVFGSTVYAFGLMLLLFLIGIAIGSAIFARMRRADPVRVLGLALIGNTAAALLGIAAVPHLPTVYMRGFPAVRDSFLLQQAMQVLETAPVLLPMAILFGIAFPAAVAATRESAGMGRGVGRVMAWNTVGTVGGAFLGGFVLIPQLGLRASLTVAAAATAVGGVLALRRLGQPSWTRAGLVAAAAALWSLCCSRPGRSTSSRREPASTPRASSTEAALLDAARASELLYYKDGIATTLSVDRQGLYRFYRSNGKTDASTAPGDMANQLLLGHLPMLVHPAPRDVFVLGLGTGVSAAAIARYPVGLDGDRGHRVGGRAMRRSSSSRRTAASSRTPGCASSSPTDATPFSRARTPTTSSSRTPPTCGSRASATSSRRSSTRWRARACGRAASWCSGSTCTRCRRRT